MRENRTDLGIHFSEGARRLWLVLKERGPQSKLAAELSVSTGQLTHWLYGDRRPNAKSAAKIQAALDIPAGLWGTDPLGKFEAPAAIAHDERRAGRAA